MSDAVFLRLSEQIHGTCGIKMPRVKKTMLEGRLRKRLHTLGMSSFDQYCDYVLSPQGAETEYIHMINSVTTNKTDFFREPGHFDYLSRLALPELVNALGLGVKKRLNVWSAACSTGEEPYTLAMVLSEFAEVCPGFRFSILATDISTKVLAKGKSGTYDHERVDPIPISLRKKYLLRSKDKEKGVVRIAPELRAAVHFQRLNLMDEHYGIREPMGIIFCRNVIIYFDRPTQEKLLYRLSQHLAPGGYLMSGHSETFHGMDLPLAQVSSSIYRRL
jgi:chemotaxis protein methyltransferase CheR